MRKLYWTLVATFAVGLALAVSPARAQQNVNCTGTLPAGTYNNVNVAKSASCTLSSPITILGNVIVASSATLTMATGVETPPGVDIDGSVLARDALSVTLAGIVTVGKNVTLHGTTGEVEIAAVNIGGNVQIFGTSAGPIFVDANTVVGNVAVNNNSTTGPPSNRITRNTIGGNLVCVGNTPAPTDIIVIPPPTPFPNTVGGNKVGQCASL